MALDGPEREESLRAHAEEHAAFEAPYQSLALAGQQRPHRQSMWVWEAPHSSE